MSNEGVLRAGSLFYLGGRKHKIGSQKRKKKLKVPLGQEKARASETARDAYAPSLSKESSRTNQLHEPIRMRIREATRWILK